MQVHTDYPIGATVKNLHTGVIATIKQHGVTSSTDEGIELMLWMENGAIWKNWNVEVLDIADTATIALELHTRQTIAGVFGHTISARVAFETIVNLFIREVARISTSDGTPNLHSDYTIDFNDGSLLMIKLGSWAPNGFYIQYQSNRC